MFEDIIKEKDNECIYFCGYCLDFRPTGIIGICRQTHEARKFTQKACQYYKDEIKSEA